MLGFRGRTGHPATGSVRGLHAHLCNRTIACASIRDSRSGGVDSRRAVSRPGDPRANRSTDPKGVRVHVLPFDSSLPSGHAARAVILVALVSLCTARLRVLAVVWLAAVLVLLVLGAWHTPSDVLGAVLLAGAFVTPLLRDR